MQRTFPDQAHALVRLSVLANTQLITDLHKLDFFFLSRCKRVSLCVIKNKRTDQVEHAVELDRVAEGVEKQCHPASSARRLPRMRDFIATKRQASFQQLA